MNKKISLIVIDYIQNIWKKNNPDNSLLGIWLAFYEPVQNVNIIPDSPVTKCYFITNYGITEKDCTEYTVFMGHGIIPEQRYQIAYSFAANFADNLYIGYQLGSLNGKGILCEIDNNTIRQIALTWVS